MGDFVSEKTVKAFLTNQAGVILPLFQSAVSGGAVGLIVFCLAIIFDQDHPLALGGLAAGLAGGASWFISLSWWRSKTYQTKPPKLPGVYSGDILRLAVTVDSDIDSSFGGVWADLPISREKMLAVARKVVKDGNFTYASLSGRHRPLSRAEFETVRSELLRRKLLYQKSRPGDPVTVGVTRAGKAAFLRLAQMETSPTPRSPRGRQKLPDRQIGAYTHTRMEDENDILDQTWN